MFFLNRNDAGIRLNNKLKKFKNKDVIVYALPRGGVTLGYEIAKELCCPLDLIISKKVGHPYNPEYAICAIAEEGAPICNQAEVKNIDPLWLEKEVEKGRKEISRRRGKYLGTSESKSPAGKIAIIVDDGIATGLTMFAAINELKSRNPKEIIVAIPVIPSDTASKLEQEVDEVISLEITDHFLGAVGAYYRNFAQVNDKEVIHYLNAIKSINKSS